ncbi:pca operon transcriptional activator PcaQ [Roseobacter sp. MED193]|jgi:LysR family pca operon transcriptional activator|uniref:pca operon transcription factor PcaQ n=1 Tax=Rhodobacterales TaxID=204455 RepID=UPI000068A02E|nr:MULTISPECIES: pca operon transcription factor PcaQ [Roseobacteraceae]EAQ43883.1 pca operon transcriptional activator PcaQ [Roseobacter sp. MED193]
MDRRIKFRHLDTFSAIARAGSFKKAAAELNLSQPAISKALKELEGILGTDLMERDRSGIKLTQKGEVFLQFAEQSTAALRHGLRSVRTSGDAKEHLNIGVLPSVASGLLPAAVSAFLKGNPDTLLEVHEGPHTDLTSRLRSGKLDLVVGRLGRPQSMQGLVFRQLCSEEVVVVAAPQSNARSIHRFEDLDRFRVLYPPQDSAIRPLVARMLISRGIPLFPNRIETASAAFGRALTLADPNTVWIISRGVVLGDIEEGRLVRLEVDTGPTVGAVGIMSIADDVPTPAIRAFSSALIRAANRGAEANANSD